MPAAWERRNAVQLGPPRRGAGPNRWRRRIRRTTSPTPAHPACGTPPQSSGSPIAGSPAPSAPPGRRPRGPSPAGPARWPDTSSDAPPTPDATEAASRVYAGIEEDRPAIPRQQLRQHGQHQPISRLVARPCNLPSDHHQLMAQHGDLYVLGVRRATQTDQAKNTRTITNANVRTTMRASLPPTYRP
jgi:hypothetical protein